MKKIKKLTVTVTYTVRLGEIEVSDKEYNALQECFKSWTTINDNAYNDESAEIALDWLSDNINFGDEMDCKYEIDNLEEEE